MNNLYRDLAPITEAAWAEIELEATRTFKRHIAGRRVVDVSEPGGPVTAAISTGHLLDVKPPGDGVVAHLRDSRPLVRLRVPFTVSRTAIDDVERGSQDSDWDPVKEAAKKLAFVEDRAIFEGYPAASIEGIRNCSSNPALALPEDAREITDVISQALSELRLAGVDGPYSVLLSADVYTMVSETTEHGYPIREHLNRLVDGDIIWAPAIDGAFVLSTRGGDFDLQLGTDVSIGYLRPRRRHRAAVSAGNTDVPVLHLRGVGRPYALAAGISPRATVSVRRHAVIGWQFAVARGERELAANGPRGELGRQHQNPAPSRTGRARRRTGRSAPRWHARDAASTRPRGRWPSRCPRYRAASRWGCRGSGRPPGPRPRVRRAPFRRRRSGPRPTSAAPAGPRRLRSASSTPSNSRPPPARGRGRRNADRRCGSAHPAATRPHTAPENRCKYPTPAGRGPRRR